MKLVTIGSYVINLDRFVYMYDGRRGEYSGGFIVIHLAGDNEGIRITDEKQIEKFLIYLNP